MPVASVDPAAGQWLTRAIDVLRHPLGAYWQTIFPAHTLSRSTPQTPALKNYDLSGFWRFRAPGSGLSDGAGTFCAFARPAAGGARHGPYRRTARRRCVWNTCLARAFLRSSLPVSPCSFWSHMSRAASAARLPPHADGVREPVRVSDRSCYRLPCASGAHRLPWNASTSPPWATPLPIFPRCGTSARLLRDLPRTQTIELTSTVSKPCLPIITTPPRSLAQVTCAELAFPATKWYVLQREAA